MHQYKLNKAINLAINMIFDYVIKTFSVSIYVKQSVWPLCW